MVNSIYFSLFVLLPYMCIFFAMFGVLKKLFSLVTGKIFAGGFGQHARTNAQKNVLYLILLHFIGYAVIKGTFTLFGVSGDRLKNLTVLVEGIVIALFLTFITYKIFKNKIGQSASITNNNIANKLMIMLIIIHIFAGYIGIMFIQDGLSKQTTSLMLAKYYNSLFAFNPQAYVYLSDLSYITLTHLTLGFLFLGLIPYTKIIEDIITMPVTFFNYCLKKR